MSGREWSARGEGVDPPRDRAYAEVRRLLGGEGVRVGVLSGPRGRGKTSLLRAATAGVEGDLLHAELSPLPEGALLEDLHLLTARTLGPLPAPLRRGALPLASDSEGSWLALLVGLVDRIRDSRRPLVLILDGFDHLLAARRLIALELGEVLASARVDALPMALLLTARDPRGLREVIGEGELLGAPQLSLELPPLGYREAGWGHGGSDARDAFLRWSLLGDDPARLQKTQAELPLEQVIRDRVLDPAGDLSDAPLLRLETTFQKPARYAAILRALAPGPLDWSGILARVHGIDAGGQLAPYMQRLEEEGLVRVSQPLDAPPGSRARRYSVADPFDAFWFGWILPRRSLLGQVQGVEGRKRFWREELLPHLDTHFQNWMEVAARRWIEEHGEEGLGAPAREVGSLWGEGIEIPVAGRLANGQVCIGIVAWGAGGGGAIERLDRGMRESRYGFGWQARAPLLFYGVPPDVEVRRFVARDPMARVIGFDQLMGRRFGG